MKIQTHHIPSKGLDLTFEKSAGEFEALKKLIEGSACQFVAPLTITLNITPMKDFFKVKGIVRTTVRQACVRCLDDFDSGLNSRFTLNYSKAIPRDVHANATEGIELTAQQIGIIFYQEDEIDFSAAVQEQVVLSIPYKPLCSDGCKGLCVRCGQDLNKKACECGVTSNDGPFSVLKNIKLPSE